MTNQITTTVDDTDDDLDDAIDEGTCSTCIHGVSTDYADKYFYFCKKYAALTPAFGSLPYCNGDDWKRVA